MSFKKFLYSRFYAAVCKINPARFCKIKDDSRPVSPFKLVFFCGKTGTEYLNASLASVYKSWDTIPEVIITTDGTAPEVIRQKLIKWPKKVEILTWDFCASSLKENGRGDLYEYAAKDVWGKKLVGICYCAQQFPILYSDTDILWFKSPVLETLNGKTLVKMCVDVDHNYSQPLLEALNQTHMLTLPPLNAGLIYAGGEFSKFPQ
ncbi:MAG: hypothetical protein ABUL44_03340, partial [Flavobacterium sp.]